MVVREHTKKAVAASREPKYSRFTQQELPACRPVLTPRMVIAIYFSIGCLFVPIGAKCLLTSRSVVEVSQQYDGLCKSEFQTGGLCTVTLTVPRAMTPPVFVYYELNNAYFNHRRMVLSRSDAQLRGDDNIAADLLKTCAPQEFQGGNVSKLINPCGLAAWSYFNDSFVFRPSASAGCDTSVSPITVSSTGIAFKADLKTRFASKVAPAHHNDVLGLRGGAPVTTPTLAADERFVTWMRTPALSDFRKLWGRIDTPIEAGETLCVSVTNEWNSYSFGGKKRIVLSTSTWLGGRNHFLGVAYLVVGGVCLLLAAVFALLVALKGRRLADPKYYSWNKPHAARD